MKVRQIAFIGVIIALCSAAEWAQSSNTDSDMISFRLTTDKSEYRRGESALVRFTVVNQGTEPIHLNRNIGTCSRWTGHVELAILDSRNHKIPRAGCDAYVTHIPGGSLTEALNSSEWILLLPGKAYSLQEPLDLPEGRGSYSFVASLWPPGFSSDELQLLGGKKDKSVALRAFCADSNYCGQVTAIRALFGVPAKLTMRSAGAMKLLESWVKRESLR